MSLHLFERLWRYLKKRSNVCSSVGLSLRSIDNRQRRAAGLLRWARARAPDIDRQLPALSTGYRSTSVAVQPLQFLYNDRAFGARKLLALTAFVHTSRRRRMRLLRRHYCYDVIALCIVTRQFYPAFHPYKRQMWFKYYEISTVDRRMCCQLWSMTVASLSHWVSAFVYNTNGVTQRVARVRLQKLRLVNK